MTTDLWVAISPWAVIAAVWVGHRLELARHRRLTRRLALLAYTQHAIVNLSTPTTLHTGPFLADGLDIVEDR